MDFNDTFLSYQHIVESFPDYEIKCDVAEEQRNAPFRLIFEDVPEKKEDSEESSDYKEEEQQLTKSIVVQPYKFENRGPYLGNKPKQ